MIKSFKPALLFIGKFLLIYIVGNICYAFYIEYYNPSPDPATRLISDQTCHLIDMLGYEAISYDNSSKPTTVISTNGRSILSVYEGCNGINVMIIFIAFVFAYRVSKILALFIPLGLLIIHFSNLARVAGLYFITVYQPEYLYFTHKYLFTAILYVVVFGLWYGYVKLVSKEGE